MRPKGVQTGLQKVWKSKGPAVGNVAASKENLGVKGTGTPQIRVKKKGLRGWCKVTAKGASKAAVY